MGLDIEALSAVHVGQRRWRRDGDAFLTLIVKATFAYEPGRDAWLVEPEPLSLEIAEAATLDPLLRRAARAARATELAPNLRRAGVSVLGFACAPSGTMTREIELRLAVLRGPHNDEETLVDKRLHVVGDRQSVDAFPDPFEAIPLVDELCFGGPSDPTNPRGVGIGVSASTLPNVLPVDGSPRFANVGPLPVARTSALFTSIDQPVAEIHADSDWDAFQTAPADQRLMGMREFFLGDERIVMEGMDRAAPRIDVRLPRVRALARWARAGRGARALELRGDCLVIDTDARRFSLTWRGQIPAPADPAERVRAAVALAFGDERDDEAAAWPAELQTLGATGQSAGALAALAASSHARPATALGRTLDVAELHDRRQDTEVGGETLTTGLVFNVGSSEPSWVARGGVKRDDRPAAPIPGAPWSPVEAKSVEAATWGEETFDPARAEAAISRTLPVAVSLLARATPLGPPPAPPPPLAIPAPPPLAAAASASTMPLPPPAPTEAVAPPPALDPARDWTPTTAEVPQTIGARLAAEQAAARAAAKERGAPKDLRRSPTAAPEPVAPPSPEEKPETQAEGAAERKPDRVVPLAIDAKPTRALRPPRESPARSECVARLEKGASLEGMALSGVDLSGIDFRERSLARAVLTGARLEAANLARCNLTGALLDDADLTEADLTGAILTRADASRAVLTDAKLDRAQLVDAVLEGAKADGASFRSATGMRTILKHAALAGAVFASASLDRADLTGATLDRADFSGATLLRGRFDEARATGLVLSAARMNDSRWEGAKLDAIEARGLSAQHAVWTGATIARANFEKADLRSAHLRGVKLGHGTLTDADLRDVDLREADLTGANFTRANLEGAILARATGAGVTFDGARLSGADARDVAFTDATLKEASCVRARLDGAKLVGADLTRADLRHAWLRDAKLGRVDLSQALVDGADLRGAELEGATLYKVDLGRARTGHVGRSAHGGPSASRERPEVSATQALPTTVDVKTK